MAKVDLHVHSCCSKHPSEWFLQRIGARESYIEPEDVYRSAKRAGMDFVTLTDHNTMEGVLRLKKRYPHDVLTGVEVTAYFKDCGTKIHILVWGLSEEQFAVIDKLRTDITELRDYLVGQGLAHAVAHLTFSVNGQLTFEHVERLLLMFDRFETDNGSREKINSDILHQVLFSLTPARIQELEERYFVEPSNPDSWRKGATGGSDDHSGLFIGTTFTEAEAATPEEFIRKIMAKQTHPRGRHSDYRSLAFAVYKVAFDFSRAKNSFAPTLLSVVNSLLFDEKPVGFKKQFVLKKLKASSARHKKGVPRLLGDLVQKLQQDQSLSADQKLSLVSETVSNATDELFRGLFETIGDHMCEGDLGGLVQAVSGVLPGIFLSIPFFTSLNSLNESRWLLDKLSEQYVAPECRKKKKILWFSDTLLELSGVSATLQEIAHLSKKRGLSLSIATCLPPESGRTAPLPPNILELPSIYEYTPGFFKTFTLRFPSVLGSLRLICEAGADEIYISTPGPVGLLGLLAAKLLHIPSRAVYHTDFTRQAKQIIGDETMCRITEDYVNWFHSQADIVAAPSVEYMDQLRQRGINPSKIRHFRRGIDPSVFAPVASKEFLAGAFGITDGVTLLHSGRVSREKNIDFLAEVYGSLIKQDPAVNLIFAGDGPYFNEFKGKMKSFSRVFFAGRLDRKDLAPLYSASDLLVFPSITDTFGMVILEAQSCGLPAIVSDFGGPKGIIVNGKTGFVAKANDCAVWQDKIEGVIEMINRYPRLYLEMRAESRRHCVETYTWDVVLEDIFGKTAAESWTDGEHGDYSTFKEAPDLEQTVAL